MFRKKHFTALIIALVIGGVFSLAFASGFFVSWRYRLTDKLFLQREPSQEVIIVAIDNKSLEQIGRWPWPRQVMAQLIEKVDEQNPLLIGLDVNFSETSDSDSDEALAQAIEKAGQVVLPLEAELEIEKDKIIAREIVWPLPLIREKALGLGLTNTPPDSDGIFRRVPLFVSDQEHNQYSAFAAVLARFYLEKKGLVLPSIPIDQKGQMLVNYLGPAQTFRMIPALSVMNGEVEKGDLEDKIVLIGATAPDLHDEQLVPTSQGRAMSGVEIHANILETILSGHFLTPLKTFWQIVFFFILALVFCLILACFKIITGSLLALFALMLYLFVSLMVFDQGLVLDLFYVLLIFIFSYGLVVAWRYFGERKEKQRIKNAFSHYVSPDIINELMAHPEKLKLGGEKREVSILFSDIRGFTSISEKLSPEQLVALLNDYLTAMTNLILEKRGVLDKYIGDAIMAFWGAPLSERRHGRYALETALAMIKSLKENKKKWQKDFGVELNIGIGINRGEVIAGNMGSSQRFDYTVMGDAVNLASRLEGLTKQYGVKIIVSEFTRKAAGDWFNFRYLDKVAVKGKEKGVEIYELLGERELPLKQKELVELFEQGIKIYQNQDWNKALEFFTLLLKKYPDDGPTQVYLKRCQELKENPPQDWDGIYHAQSK